MRKFPLPEVSPEKLKDHWKEFGPLLTQEEHEALDTLLNQGHKTCAPDDIRRVLETAME